MQYFIGDWLGLSHLFFAFLSLLFGTLIVFQKKGTKRHKTNGYTYLIVMTLTNISAFMIYRLFGSFGPFHIAALISLSTIYAGIIPIWRKRPKTAWQYLHFNFMYWSVVGLYMAFVAEILTRIPSTPFFGMVGLAMAMVLLFGVWYFKKKKGEWEEIFKLN